MSTAQWDYQQKKEAALFGNKLIDQVMEYLCRAIQTANRNGNIPDDVFWKNLFIREGTGKWDASQARATNDMPLLAAKQDCSPNRCPENPYSNMDFQLCNKYLYYGGDRILTQDPLTYAEDSYQYCVYFNIPYRRRDTLQPHQIGRSGPTGEYRQTVQKSIFLRNGYKHGNLAVIANITEEKLVQDIQLLKQLTAPLARIPGWEAQFALEPVSKMWARTDREYFQKFGAAPIGMNELALELFCSDEETLTQEQMTAFRHAVETFQLVVRNGKIYNQPDRNALKKMLSMHTEVAGLLHIPAASTPEEARAQAAAVQAQYDETPAARPAREQPMWAALPPQDTQLLRKAGFQAAPEPKFIAALLKCFIPLVDESVFLSREGRALLIQHVGPELRRAGKKLPVDESVVSTLFRQFRGSAPYSPLELAALTREIQDDPETDRQQKQEREALLQESIATRESLHKLTKEAIKALRLLRERRQLEVVASPTRSEHSYDNLRALAERYPQERFLAITMDRQLSEELSAVSGGNVAAAKPMPDGRLLFFRATRDAYQAMLREEQAAAPAAEHRPPAAADAVPAAVGVDTAVPAAGTLSAEWPDGRRQGISLGKELARGGEGAILEAPGGAVAKLYFARQLTAERKEKLRYMVAHDPGIQELCWPQALLYDAAGRWVGYLMPRAAGKELARTVFHPGVNYRRLTEQGWTRRSLALIAANIASAFARMHERGILMGDINPRNILADTDCSVRFVDCDSFQIGPYDCPVGTPLYTPPEVHRQMRERGVVDYGYHRTEAHERYSLAVLLFEILMLGKAPYESRNADNEDVIQAIITGNFPYPYKSDADTGETRGGIAAPVGIWRQIWSHTTFAVKTAFYNTFTGDNRLSAREWEQTMREYHRQIGLDHSTDELAPTGYKTVAVDEDDSPMKTLTCETCGCTFTMDERTYDQRVRRGDPILCNVHWENEMNFRRRPYMAVCSVCGKRYQTTTADWLERQESGKAMVCPACLTVQVPCTACGKLFEEKRERVERIRSRGSNLYCPACSELMLPRVTCEQCGETFRMRKDQLERRQRFHEKLLCAKCRQAR